MIALTLALVVWLVARDLARQPLRRPVATYCLRHGPQGFKCYRWRLPHRWHACGSLEWRDGWKGWGGSNTTITEDADGRITCRWKNYADPEDLPYHPGGEQDDGGRG